VELCTFRQTFQDGSSYDSFAMTDVMTMDGMHLSNKVMFGCHLSESAQLRAQRVTGVIGMAPTKKDRQYRGFADDILANFEHQAFAVSLKGKGGALDLGVRVGKSDRLFQMGIDGGKYEVYPDALKVEKASFSAQALGLTYIDSGTSFTYLPKIIGTQLLDTVNLHCKQPECSKVSDNCWRFSGLKGSTPDFPAITMSFRTTEWASAPTAWSADDYMLPVDKDSGMWCTSFLAHDEPTTILGASWMINKRVTFSLEPGRLGVGIDPLQDEITLVAVCVYLALGLGFLWCCHSCCCPPCCCRAREAHDQSNIQNAPGAHPNGTTLLGSKPAKQQQYAPQPVAQQSGWFSSPSRQEQLQQQQQLQLQQQQQQRMELQAAQQRSGDDSWFGSLWSKPQMEEQQSFQPIQPVEQPAGGGGWMWSRSDQQHDTSAARGQPNQWQHQRLPSAQQHGGRGWHGGQPYVNTEAANGGGWFS